MNNLTTGSVVGATSVIAAVVVIAQVLIQAIAPDHFWAFVQTKSEFWAALQAILNFAALHFWPKLFGGKEPPP